MRPVTLLLLAMLLLAPAPSAGQQLNVPEAGPGRLKAERVRYDARTQTFHAEGNVVLTIGDLVIQAPQLRVEQRRRTVQATGGVVVRQSGTILRARELLYEISPRLVRASGDVVLEYEGTSVTTARLTLDVSAQVVRGEGGVRVTREGTTATGDQMVAHLTSRRAEISGHAVLVRAAEAPTTTRDPAARALAAQETKVTADRLRFRWDANEAEAQGTVVLTQPDKTARADTMVYSEPRGVIELIGRVDVVQRDSDWLVEGGVVAAPRDAEGAKALAAPVHLQADRLVVRIETRDMQADGHVRVEQERRLATGDRAVYDQRAQTLVVVGNVRLREEDGSWLRADKVVIAIADETFEATGNVETEFTVTRGK